MKKHNPTLRLTSSLTLLGTGTSTGVPLIGCKCPVCTSRNPKDRRLRASAWLQMAGLSILIDTSTDLRQQALHHGISRVDAILFSHPHADHVHGIDEIRAYNFLQKAPIRAFGNSWTVSHLKEKFDYIFKRGPPGSQEGGGIPQIDLHEVPSNAETIEVSPGAPPIIPLPAPHGSKNWTLGFRVGSIAYLTDCSSIPPSTLDRMRGLDTLVLDCVRFDPHRTHLNLKGALEIVAELKPKKTFLTHLGHEFGVTRWKKQAKLRGITVPPSVQLAMDGMKILF